VDLGAPEPGGARQSRVGAALRFGDLPQQIPRRMSDCGRSRGISRARAEQLEVLLVPEPHDDARCVLPSLQRVSLSAECALHRQDAVESFPD
jgi:hypothetical protein